jgi:hypothetical protein
MRTLRLVLFLLLAISAAGATTAAAQDPAGTPAATPLTLLFVQQAAGGTLAPAGADEWTLNLTGVFPHTVYFADRPARAAGTVPTAELVTVPELFDPANPPNAAIVLAEPTSAEEDVLIVELREPIYDAAAGTLRYTVTLLENIGDGGLVTWSERADAALPEAFGHVSLFIDEYNVMHDPTCFVTSWAWCTFVEETSG